MVLKIKSPRDVSYEIEIKGKYTLITGDSGTGKTFFTELVQALKDKVVLLDSPLKPHVISEDADVSVLSKYENSILIFDEYCTILRTPDVAGFLQKSNNYFLIISRKVFGWLPVSVDSVYVLQNSGKFHKAVPAYERFDLKDLGKIDLILTEDKKSSFIFFSKYFPNIDVKSSNGKDNLSTSLLLKLLENKYKNILVVYDAAAFGNNIAKLFSVLNQVGCTNVKVLDWESFEWYILNSKFFEIDQQKEPYPLTLSKTGYEYESLEQMCTILLKDKVNYTKSHLPTCMHIARDCSKCSLVADCKYKTKKTSKDLFIYGIIGTINNSNLKDMTCF